MMMMMMSGVIDDERTFSESYIMKNYTQLVSYST